MRKSILAPAIALLILLTVPEVLAQTGKIAGVVTDAASGEPLAGVNVIVDGTTLGASTDSDGYYVILNVAPGSHTIQATFIGFTSQLVSDVRVNIDLTTDLNIQLEEQSVGLEEVVVTAQTPIVRRDISANVINLSSDELTEMPVNSLEEVVELEAGVEEGLIVRGSGRDQLAFVVDGISMRDGRTNSPVVGISYTSIDEIQVQTGGFNAEYGNVRSGLINVTTKSGSVDRYFADVLLRYSAPQRKHFGPAPNDPSTYWMRPYVDPDVRMAGPNQDESPWDIYEQNQYPRFDGWERVSEQSLADDDPTNDITPEQAMEIFQWTHRKDFSITAPDYDVDATIRGPVPGVSRFLGGLRFTASYRQQQSAYVIPYARDAVKSRTGQFKLTSDVREGMRLDLVGLYNIDTGLNGANDGSAGVEGPIDLAGRITGNAGELFSNHALSLRDDQRSLVGLNFTHTLGAKTFYNVEVQRMYSDFSAGPPRARDNTVVKTVGNVQLDEAPMGWVVEPIDAPGGFNMGGHWAEARDSSNVAVYNARASVTSQLNRYSLFKAGGELIYSLYNMNHGQTGYWKNNAYPYYSWKEEPMQGALFAQNKFEFRGLVANLGLRLDYFDPNSTWYDFNPFSHAFSSQYGFDEVRIQQLDDIEPAPTEMQLTVSPRLGVSFPITEVSKLYFNYGHFRQMLNPGDIFAVQTLPWGAVGWMGNPNHPMPKTVAYELGYEHNLFQQFLLRLTGYYKALDNQSRRTRFASLDGRVDYTYSLPTNYGDIRGFEVSLRKNVGWFRGFLNYTYMARKSGNYGEGIYYENRAEQRRYVSTTTDYYISRPIPEPYARMNLTFSTPAQAGPEIARVHPLAGLHLNLLGSWRMGRADTWTGGEGDVRGLQNNVRWRDDYNLDLRLTKTISMGTSEANFFIDVSNVMNSRRMDELGFFGSQDFERYMMSLHLDEDVFSGAENFAPYRFISGNDKPGDYRKPGVEFMPIEVVQSLDNVGSPVERPLYYVQDTETYMVYRSGGFQEADSGMVRHVLDDKAYIDMPNLTYFTFFDPRRVTFGMRISL